MNGSKQATLSPEIREQLKILKSEANGSHKLFEGAAFTALENARSAGAALAKIQAILKHGEWESWATEHLGFSLRTARAYLRIYRHWPAIEARRAEFPALNLSEAITRLSTPKRQSAADLDEESEDELRASLLQKQEDIVSEQMPNLDFGLLNRINQNDNAVPEWLPEPGQMVLGTFGNERFIFIESCHWQPEFVRMAWTTNDTHPATDDAGLGCTLEWDQRGIRRDVAETVLRHYRHINPDIVQWREPLPATFANNIFRDEIPDWKYPEMAVPA